MLHLALEWTDGQWAMLSKSPSALSWGLPQEVWSQQLFLFCMNSTCGTVNRVHLWDSVRDLFLAQITFFLKTWKPGVQDRGKLAVRSRQWSTQTEVSKLSKSLQQSCWQDLRRKRSRSVLTGSWCVQWPCGGEPQGRGKEDGRMLQQRIKWGRLAPAVLGLCGDWQQGPQL